MVELLDMATDVIKINSTAEFCKGKKYFEWHGFDTLGYINCVYTWRRNGIWLYIGASRRGTWRINTNRLITRDRFKPDDVMWFYFLDPALTWKEVCGQETRLIAKYNPHYNIMGRTGNQQNTKVLRLVECYSDPKPAPYFMCE